MVVLGGGPAGLTAAIYASRARLKTLLIEKNYPGGQVMMCENIENYPGYVAGSSGFELCNSMKEQAERFGMETLLAEVVEVDLDGPEKILHTASGEEFVPGPLS